MNMKIAVIYNEPAAGRPDSEDVLDQAGLVKGSLKKLGFSCKTFSIRGTYPSDNNPPSPSFSKVGMGGLSGEIILVLNRLKKFSPAVIFNLVESFGDNQRFYPVWTSLLELSGYRYTGSAFDVLLTTTNKALAKAVLTAYDIPTPRWELYSSKGHDGDCETKTLSFKIPFSRGILKPAWEDASVGIDDDSVFTGRGSLMPKLSKMCSKFRGQPILIEEYIEGREFNVSLFERSNGAVEALPAAEMVFVNWPKKKPRIVNYSAKWDKGSFEYSNTIRKFNTGNVPLSLIKDLALKCWSVFGLSGYARVDMRMDKEGKVFVIEVNANPCIAPDSGFIMSVREAGYDAKDVIGEIVNAAAPELKSATEFH